MINGEFTDKVGKLEVEIKKLQEEINIKNQELAEKNTILETYRNLFEHAPLSYQSLDENGNFLRVNEKWCQIFGYKQEEIIGKNFSELLPEKYKEVFQENFPKFKKMGYIFGVEFEMLKKDSTEIIVRFYGKIGTNVDGSFLQTHCVLNDVTELKKKEKELKEYTERYRLLFENANIGIGFYDLNGQVISYNKIAARHLGGRPEDFTGKSFDDLFPKDTAAEYWKRFRHAIQTEKTNEYIDKIELPNEYQWFSTSYSVVKNDDGQIT